MAALAHDEGLVDVVADLVFAIVVLRSALLRIKRPDPGRETRGESE